MIRLDHGLRRARPLLLYEADRLERLARDLRRIADGTGPTSEEVAAAPVIDAWAWAERTLPCLVGRGSGHPRLGSGSVLTTEVWAADQTAGWVRTLGRWYVLGVSAAR
ncbi:DUF6634 family protein [Roseomonas gilardii]|uniref:DUF6634 family protein n=1 Tax=Roseomonas gilardii TaxID=257708 RepID=UPI00351A7E04